MTDLAVLGASRVVVAIGEYRQSRDTCTGAGATVQTSAAELKSELKQQDMQVQLRNMIQASQDSRVGMHLYRWVVRWRVTWRG